MRILIGGSGTLGKCFFKLINKNKNIYTKLNALRKTNLSTFKNEFKLLDDGDIFIDSMDANDIDINFDEKINQRANLFREYALENCQNKTYIYLSTCNLYKESLVEIDESAEIKSILSPYLKMKLNSEEKIKRLCKGNYAILRIVNIWSDLSKNSFFGDLLNAKNNNFQIKPRNNDDLVISFAHMEDVCKIIENVILSKKFGIINISTNSFNSRKNLKALVNKERTKPILNNLGYRVRSNVINWKSILNKKQELF